MKTGPATQDRVLPEDMVTKYLIPAIKTTIF